MRRCNNCDITLPDSDKFCPNCGMLTVEADDQALPNEAAVARQKTKKNKKKLITGMIIGALALLIVVGAAVFFKIYYSPMLRFARAQNSFFFADSRSASSPEAVFAGRYSPGFANISTDGTLSIEDIKGVDPDTEKLLKSISVRLNTDNHDGSHILGTAIDYKGSSMLTYTITADKEHMGFHSPELSKEYYVVKNERVADSLLAMLETDDKLEFDEVINLEKSYKEIKNRYKKLLAKAFANEDFSMTGGSVMLKSISEEVKGCKRITYTPDKERLAVMLRELGSEIGGDKKLSDHILSLLVEYFGEDYANAAITLIAQGYAERGFDTKDGLLPILKLAGDEIGKRAEETAQAIIDSKLEWTVVTKNGKAIAQYLTLDGGCIEFERYGNKTYFSVKSGEDTVLFILSDLEEKDGLLSGKVTVEFEGGGKIVVLVTDMDNDRRSALGAPCGEYDINFSDGSSEDFRILISVKAAERGGTDHRITIPELSISIPDDIGDELPISGIPNSITFNYHTTDKASSVKVPDASVTKIESSEQAVGVTESLREELGKVIVSFMIRTSIIDFGI